MKDPILENSDAWLLLAIIYASANGPANLWEIIGFGDMINHAIFTVDELNGGFTRLSQEGFIKQHDGMTFSAIKKILKPYRDFAIKRRRIDTALEFVRKEISAKEYLPKVNLKEVNHGYSYEGINDESVNKAYKEYVSSLKQK